MKAKKVLALSVWENTMRRDYPSSISGHDVAPNHGAEVFKFCFWDMRRLMSIHCVGHDQRSFIN
jgi:hypothetical protein